MLEKGIKGKRTLVVDETNTAKAMGSGTLDVFATPAMIGLIEQTCWMSVADELEEGKSTVGTKLEIDHNSPTALGMTVTCESELIEAEGRRLLFRVTCYDAVTVVGSGTHERYIIDTESFMNKVGQKKDLFLISTLAQATQNK